MENLLELPQKKVDKGDNTTLTGDNATVSGDNTTEKYKSLDLVGEKPVIHKPVEIETPSFDKARSRDISLELEPIDASKLALEDKPVLINVDGMPLSDFVIHAVGEALKVTFFIDEAVKSMKNPVTLHMTKEMPAAKTLEIVVELLRQQGLLVGAKAGSLYILKPGEGGEPVDIRVGRDVPVSTAKIVQIVALKYIAAAEMSALIADFYKTALVTKAYAKENAILITGPAATIRECLNLIDIMDVPYLKQKRVILLKLTYWKPEEFVSQITAILNGLGLSTSTNPKEPGVSFIPIKFLNSVMAVAPDEQSTQLVIQWKERLDTAESAGAGEKTFTYFPRFSRAVELVDTVQKLYGLKSPVQQTAAASKTVLDKQKNSAGDFGSTKASSTTSAGSTAAPLATGTTAAATGVSVITLPNAPDVQIRITSDDRRNVVIMMTTPSIYRSLLSLLKEIDTPPRQVLIEGTVAELSVDNSNELGFEGLIKGRMLGGNFAASTVGLLGANSAGTIFSFMADHNNAKMLLDALAKENKIEILMKPHLMVMDNQEASIEVGDDVPVITSEVSTTDTVSTSTTPSILRNVSYVQTGLILTLTPTINADGLVTLEITSEVSEAQTNDTSGIDSPTIRKRKVKTKVVVGNGQTVILGGIRSKQYSVSENKIPLLGDIPIIGYAFKFTSQEVKRTELLVFITPRILTNTDDAHNITKEIGERFEWFNK
ncbi:MAG: type II secretion system secretin GspD [Nitrospirae bacterium]|nr:type II secretion system secretin GspD [Nitrospirota bacterium]